MRTILHDYVLIKVDEYDRKTEDGLYRAEQWQSLPPTGVVIAVGPQVTLVKPNDRVHFLRYAAIDGRDEFERLCKEIHIVEVING